MQASMNEADLDYGRRGISKSCAGRSPDTRDPGMNSDRRALPSEVASAFEGRTWSSGFADGYSADRRVASFLR